MSAKQLNRYHHGLHQSVPLTQARRAIALGWFLLLLCGCTGSAETPQITCQTAYRSSVAVPIEAEQQVTLTPENRQQIVTYTDLAFQARLETEQIGVQTGWALSTVAKVNGSDDVLIATLYQLPTGQPLQNQFVGDHGFTGLTFVYHPESQAELQFWCVTAE